MDQSKHSQGVTSVKVHQKPGGASSIVFGDYVEPKPAQKQGAVGAPKIEEEKKEEEETKVDANKKQDPASLPAAGVKPTQQTSATPIAVDASGKPIVTSIKVHNPPGGKSSGLW